MEDTILYDYRIHLVGDICVRYFHADEGLVIVNVSTA